MFDLAEGLEVASRVFFDGGKIGDVDRECGDIRADLFGGLFREGPVVIPDRDPLAPEATNRSAIARPKPCAPR